MNPVTLRLNHPKNHVGVPLAAVAETPTEEAIEEYLVSIPKYALQGAHYLGLIKEPRPSGLTSLGERVVRHAKNNGDGGVEESLERFRELKGSKKRFINQLPGWEEITKEIYLDVDVVEDIATILDLTEAVTLPVLLKRSITHGFGVEEVFLKTPDIAREKPGEVLGMPCSYYGEAVYQLKNNLYHAGIVTNRGCDTSALVPNHEVWDLEKNHDPRKDTVCSEMDRVAVADGGGV